MLTREQIGKVDDRKIVTEKVPEWGGEVGIRVMSGKGRSEFETFLISKRKSDEEITDTKGLRSFLLGKTLVDDNGNPLYDEKSIEELEEKNANVLERLFQKSMEVNGLSETIEDEVEKN